MDYFKRVIGNKDLRKKILSIVFLLFISRLIAHVPIPGPNPAEIKEFLTTAFQSNQVLSFLDIFSGGGFSRFSIALMGVGPYITASIMIQLLTIVVPKFEALSKEGEQGQRKINQYSRYLAVPISFIEGYGMIRLLQASTSQAKMNFLSNLNIVQWFIILLSITAGTMILMLIGEHITEKGLGNGISIIIFAGIVARLPQSIGQAIQKLFIGEFDPTQLIKLAVYIFLVFAVIVAIVFVTEAMRKLPISYAKKVRGAKLYGGIDTFLPIKLNMAGVIPIIFAGAFMNIPTIVGFLGSAKTAWIANSAKYIKDTFAPQTYPYAVLLFIMVFAFTFFSTYIYFKPKDVAENIQKQGGFIPGIRPGTQTEKYLNYLINRTTLWGAAFLSLIAVLPFIIQPFIGDSNLSLGGTSLLIVVGVAIEVRGQFEAQLIIRSYEDF